MSATQFNLFDAVSGVSRPFGISFTGSVYMQQVVVSFGATPAPVTSSNPLPVTGSFTFSPAAGNGTDFSGSPPSLDTLLGTYTVVNPGCYFVQNQSANPLQVVFDNGSGGDQTIQILSSGGAAGSQGGDTNPPMSFFTGRMRVFGQPSSQYAARGY